jgi:hypothetical protein
MSDMIVLEGTITEEGRLVVELPADAPRGTVEVTIAAKSNQKRPKFLSKEEEIAWEEAYDPELEALWEDYVKNGPIGATAQEIANAPEFGAWADRTDIISGEDYVEKLRSRRRYTW